MDNQKKWRENITEHGTLINIKDDGLCEPVTVEQWWELAPWQSIDRATKGCFYIGINNNNAIKIVELSSGFRIGNSYFKEERFTDSLGRLFDPIKLIPLPQN